MCSYVITKLEFSYTRIEMQIEEEIIYFTRLLHMLTPKLETKYDLSLSQTSPGFYVSPVQAF